MKTYIFKTTATMKEYNRRKWWIDGNVVTDERITAESLKAALDQFAERVKEKHYITISRNALSNKSPMYIDGAAGEPVQVGFVITGKTDFQDDFGRWRGQYIDLGIEILSVSPVDFEGGGGLMILVLLILFPFLVLADCVKKNK